MFNEVHENPIVCPGESVSHFLTTNLANKRLLSALSSTLANFVYEDWCIWCSKNKTKGATYKHIISETVQLPSQLVSTRDLERGEIVKVRHKTLNPHHDIGMKLLLFHFLSLSTHQEWFLFLR